MNDTLEKEQNQFLFEPFKKWVAITNIEETKGKTIFLKLDEDGDEATEYFEVNTIEDYNELEKIVYEYNKQGILDEYWIYQN